MFVRLLKRAFPKLQRAARKVGVHIDYFGRAGNAPDADLYRPLFSPWLSADWRAKLRAEDEHSLVSLDRKYVLYQTLSQTIKQCAGSVAECGVYKGGTAYILATILQNEKRRFHLFDTFSGMPETNPDKDVHEKGDFADTSFAGVQRYLAGFDFVEFHSGFVPESLAAVSAEDFAFVHIDLDIHDAILAATAFFYSRMPSRSVLVYDDYGFPSCPGARAAVDTFFADKPEVPFVLPTGQCIVWKI